MIQYLTKDQKGILLIITGSVLLLHTMGFLAKGLDIIIIIGALGLIIYGFILADYYQKIQAFIKKYEKK